MNVNFGIMSPIKEKIRDKKLKKQRIAERALATLEEFKKNL
jgi:methylenetetrahydrofolate--tRNA-(uracil-5-)-methyltransferase